METDPLVLGLRWTARVWSVLSVAFILMFVVGEGIGGGGSRLGLKTWVGLALFPIGVCAGLAVSWFREAWGGVLAIGCLIAFYAWEWLLCGVWPRGPFFFLVAAPGLLFLTASFLSPPHGAHD
jgi:hypothetical protein